MSNAKQTEESVILASKSQQIEILEILPEALFLIDRQERVLYANETAAIRVGVPKQNLAGCSFWQCAPDFISLELYCALAKVFQTPEPLQIEYRSSITSNMLYVHLLPVNEGIVLSIYEDKLNQTSQGISRSGEQLHRNILEHLPTSLAILTIDGIVLDINQLPLQQTGLGRTDILGKPFEETLWWPFSPLAQSQLHLALKQARQGETVHFEIRVHSLSGQYLDRSATLMPHQDADGQVKYLIYSSSDITVSKRVEDDLRVLAETMPQLVWATRPDGYMEYANHQYIDYVELPFESVQGFGWRHLLHPDDHDAVVAARSRSLITGDPYEIEYRLRQSRTGTYRWFLARGAPMRDESGKITRWFGTCTDIEDQKQIEENLRQSQERAQALMESTIMGIIVVDNERLVEANAAFLELTGYTREEVQDGRLNLATMGLTECSHRNQQTSETLAACEQMKPYETTCIRKDGSVLPILVGGVVLPHNPSKKIGFVLDNSARKELEQRKDDFLSMASHELKTPLTSLKLQTQLLGKQLARQGLPTAPLALVRMDTQVKKLERLIGELLDVSKIQAGRLEYIQERVHLDELLSDVAETLQQLSSTHTILIQNSAPVTLIGDRDRLGQVFTNLISNAIKYAPDSNRVEITTSGSTDTVTVSVRDWGIGIPREQLGKIFERFYRAVTPSQKGFPGLGMGLYIVAEIVRQHGGTITVESESGKGSTFHVTLPLNRNMLYV